MADEVEATLVVPHGLGAFRTQALGEVWEGASSRSARTKCVRALRELFGARTKVSWAFVLPQPVASDVEAYHTLAASRRAGDRRMLAHERVAIARQLLQCRLSISEAACVLGITPAWLGRLFEADRRVG